MQNQTFHRWGLFGAQLGFLDQSFPLVVAENTVWSGRFRERFAVEPLVWSYARSSSMKGTT
jgi:hypothetical protein